MIAKEIAEKKVQTGLAASHPASHTSKDWDIA